MAKTKRKSARVQPDIVIHSTDRPNWVMEKWKKDHGEEWDRVTALIRKNGFDCPLVPMKKADPDDDDYSDLIPIGG